MHQLSPEEVELTRTLPKKYPAVTLQGNIVRLEPFDADRDIPVLYERTNGNPYTVGSKHIEAYDNDELVFKYLFFGPFSSPQEFKDAIEPLANAPNNTFFTVFELETNSQIGFMSMMNNFPEHLKVEIGHIMLCTAAQRTGANFEANYLLLNHSFGLGYRRLEWKCNNLNERSKNAALGIGYIAEGVQRYHMILKGKNRDTAWFRILSREWSEVKLRMEAKMNSYRQ